MLADGAKPPEEVVAAMDAYGVDVRAHRSQVATAADLADADLVLGMAREHVRQAVVLDPDVWPRAFTLKELVRRGQLVGQRPDSEPLADWLARAGEDRNRAVLLGNSPTDDVADPIGGPPQAYTATAAQLDDLVSSLVNVCWSG
jgi:protein-tyrosine phosphatase